MDGNNLLGAARGSPRTGLPGHTRPPCWERGGVAEQWQHMPCEHIMSPVSGGARRGGWGTTQLNTPTPKLEL